MRRINLRFPSPALVVALIALFVALGGTSHAARHAIGSIAKATVGSGQIKNGAVTNPKIRNGAVSTAKIQNNAVASAKIKNHAVTKAKLAPGVIISGPKGPRGLQGPRGPAGATGGHAHTIVLRDRQIIPAATRVGTASVTCPAGQRATGGGGRVSINVPLTISEPITNGLPSNPGHPPRGWQVTYQVSAADPAPIANWIVDVYAICST
jgi:hypothetical protein